MEIMYRIGGPEDRPAVVRFWCDHSGWGYMDESMWEFFFGQTPKGPSVISLAFDQQTGEILGQLLFFPIPVSVDGNETLAYRIFALITKKGVPKQSLLNPLKGLIYQMYLTAASFLSDQGAGLVYLLPNPRLVRFFSVAPYAKTAAFPLYTRLLAFETDTSLPQSLSVCPLEYSDPRIDELWENTRTHYRCIAWRNRAFLQWKNSHRDYQLIGIMQGSTLIGSFVIIRKVQDRQYLICDILSIDNNNTLRAVLLGACAYAREQELTFPQEEQVIEKVSLLCTPLLSPIATELGFRQADYSFTLVIHQLDPSLPQDTIAPENWYISAND